MPGCIPVLHEKRKQEEEAPSPRSGPPRPGRPKEKNIQQDRAAYFIYAQTIKEGEECFLHLFKDTFNINFSHEVANRLLD